MKEDIGLISLGNRFILGFGFCRRNRILLGFLESFWIIVIKFLVI